MTVKLVIFLTVMITAKNASVNKSTVLTNTVNENMGQSMRNGRSHCSIETSSLSIIYTLLLTYS